MEHEYVTARCRLLFGQEWQIRPYANMHLPSSPSVSYILDKPLDLFLTSVCVSYVKTV